MIFKLADSALFSNHRLKFLMNFFLMFHKRMHNELLFLVGMHLHFTIFLEETHSSKHFAVLRIETEQNFVNKPIKTNTL